MKNYIFISHTCINDSLHLFEIF